MSVAQSVPGIATNCIIPHPTPPTHPPTSQSPKLGPMPQVQQGGEKQQGWATQSQLGGACIIPSKYKVSFAK